MRRPRPGIGTELLPMALILACLGCTLGLVIMMHRRTIAESAARRRPAPPPVVLAPPTPIVPEEIDEPAPPPPPVVAPAPPPVDPTRQAIARIEAELAEQNRAARAADIQTESLETARQAAVAESQRWRRRETLVHAQLDALDDQAATLEREADALAMERDVLLRERDDEKATLARVQSRGGGYAVLPHRGANGTWQRPVVLECRDGKAFLQPNGPSFTLLDMAPILGPRSPLITAVANALVRSQRASSPDGAPVVPYIYFIVRPDGVRSYYQARGILEPLGIAFGYELVEQETSIDFPDLDDLASWDGAGGPRTKSSTPGLMAGDRGTGSREFVWPADRPAGPGGGGSFMWPTKPPGGGGIRGGMDDPGRAEGSLDSSRGGIGSTRVEDQLRERLGRGGNTDPSTLDDLISGLEQSARAGVRSGPRGGTGGPSANARNGENPGLVALNADGLPGFDRVGDPGPDSLSGLNGKPGGSSQPTPNPRRGAVSGPARIVRPSSGDGREAGAGSPSNDNRVWIDPWTLALSEDDKRWDQLDNSSQNQGAAEVRGDAAPPTAAGVGRPTSNGQTGRETVGIGLPPVGGSPSSTGAKGSAQPLPSRPQFSAPTKPIGIEVPLVLTVVCGPDGVVVHPGGYRLTFNALEKAGILERDLKTIVRNHEIIDPMIHPKPRLEFLIEPGGSETFSIARRQTVLAGLGWPVSIHVAESASARMFAKERF